MNSYVDLSATYLGRDIKEKQNEILNFLKHCLGLKQKCSHRIACVMTVAFANCRFE